MASSGKRKTTFAKLAREQRVRERRQEKQARKDARRQTEAMNPARFGHATPADDDQDERVNSIVG
jgi:hypothetical protein